MTKTQIAALKTTKKTKTPRLERPMTAREKHLLLGIINDLEHCSSLARICVEGETPRKGWHAARAALYLRSAVRASSKDLLELGPAMGAEEAYQKKPLSPQQRGRIVAAVRRAASPARAS